MSKKMIVLKSSDGESFEIEEAVALQSETIAHMVGEEGADNIIPLADVKSQVLTKVMEYCKKHDGGDDSSSEDLRKWETEFLKKIDRAMLIDLVSAACQLKIESLSDITCQAAADVLETVSVEEARRLLGVENDFTPEEEEAIRKENQWAFQ
ncbi:unnamed protein product [Microthlaspi erraticum]|uniref:SKP1-like protein n=1 Tax=Microthlaspi erraticum TaxID=1685480 RepID=A0A6D2I0K9_9BRAS|nr:unnamed protein product [Microthlaspi erraticum]